MSFTDALEHYELVVMLHDHDPRTVSGLIERADSLLDRPEEAYAYYGAALAQAFIWAQPHMRLLESKYEDAFDLRSHLMPILESRYPEVSLADLGVSVTAYAAADHLSSHDRRERIADIADRSMVVPEHLQHRARRIVHSAGLEDVLGYR